jgi:hypothetical protein
MTGTHHEGAVTQRNGHDSLADGTDLQRAPAKVANPSAVQQFTEDLLDVKVHFQIMDLGRQLFIWVGTDAATFGSLCLASSLMSHQGLCPSNVVIVTSSVIHHVTEQHYYELPEVLQ